MLALVRDGGKGGVERGSELRSGIVTTGTELE